jgi:diphosphomevalonate decarboxylase
MPIIAKAQPNIALVKYWGKRDVEKNLPAVSSLSITLDSLQTTMSIELDENLASDELLVNGLPAADLLPRISNSLDLVAGSGRARARVNSTSNFPIGAGLASSASAFAALVVAADRAFELRLSNTDIARLAGESSGSAARSIFGGFVELLADDERIEVSQILEAGEWPIEVIVAVTETAPKPIGSSEAMIFSAGTSPFYSSWLERQDDDMRVAREAILNREFDVLAAVAEHNCMKMHSVMWTSRPAIVYWNAATLSCLEAVRDLQSAGHGVFFTIDAGPQVKAVCLAESADAVEAALDGVKGVVRTMRTGLGPGARLVAE